MPVLACHCKAAVPVVGLFLLLFLSSQRCRQLFATSMLRNFSSYVMWCPKIKDLKWDYLCEFWSIWSTIIHSKLDVTVTGLVISVSILYLISELCSILQGKINAIIFILLKWEGNWGKSEELTHTSPHTRLAEYKTEPSGRFPPSSATIIGTTSVLRSSLFCE